MKRPSSLCDSELRTGGPVTLSAVLVLALPLPLGLFPLLQELLGAGIEWGCVDT